MLVKIFYEVDNFCKQFEKEEEKKICSAYVCFCKFIFANLYEKGESDGVYFIDSTSLSVCNNKRISSNKVFRGSATRGKTSMGWFIWKVLWG